MTLKVFWAELSTTCSWMIDDPPILPTFISWCHSWNYSTHAQTVYQKLCLSTCDQEHVVVVLYIWLERPPSNSLLCMYIRVWDVKLHDTRHSVWPHHNWTPAPVDQNNCPGLSLTQSSLCQQDHRGFPPDPVTFLNWKQQGHTESTMQWWCNHLIR